MTPPGIHNIAVLVGSGNCERHRSGTGREGWRPGTPKVPSGAWFRLGWKGEYSLSTADQEAVGGVGLLHPETSTGQLFKTASRNPLAGGDDRLAFQKPSEGAVVDKGHHPRWGSATFDRRAGDIECQESQMTLFADT